MCQDSSPAIFNGFKNSAGVKMSFESDKSHDVSVILQKWEGSSGEMRGYTFTSDDDQLINLLDVVISGIVAYKAAYADQRGLKVNHSPKGIGIYSYDKEGHRFEMFAGPDDNVTIVISDNDGAVTFTFGDDDADILTRFKSTMFDAFRNQDKKLPKATGLQQAQ